MAKAKVNNVKFRAAQLADDLPDEVDFSRLAPVVGRGIHADEAAGDPPLLVAYVVVDNTSVTYSLADGRTVSAPLNWYPRLLHATPRERNDWRLVMGGRAVFWRPLDLAVSGKALLEGTKANETSASLRKWLGSRGGESRARKKSA